MTTGSGTSSQATLTIGGSHPRSKAQHGAVLQTAIDATLTCIAVELTVPRNHVSVSTIVPHLQSLQTCLELDCAFVALFDRDASRIAWVAAGNSQYQHCNPYELIGTSQPCNDELLQRLSRYQLLDVRDSTYLRGEYAGFSTRMLQLNLCSMLVGGILFAEKVAGLMVFGSLHRRNNWAMETHLAMKLMSASYAAGLERHQLHLNAGH